MKGEEEEKGQRVVYWVIVMQDQGGGLEVGPDKVD